ncbi:MAG: VWA domain-containing protein [Proteobacteria bacterium]|nr:VWA domain-containing protein [Pseudomonadota bacterium]MBU1710280.1 VWA domain-containing protein [Pseudomonadota bacterium]
MRFATPWAFLVLLVIPLILYFQLRRTNRSGVRFSSNSFTLSAGHSLRNSLIQLPLLLRIIAVILLTVALARPQAGTEKIIDISKGIAIEMVVDRSSSMGQEMDYKGERLNRLEVVKRLFTEFVQGNDTSLSGRTNDLIGMISFARYPDTICPLTLAHGALDRFMDNVQLVTQRPEDGTAIGDALMLAAARLKTAEETLARTNSDSDKKYEIKSKIIVLLTDGENNAGKTSPLDAAALAEEWGIKIYAIGVGGDDGLMKIKTFFGTQVVQTGRGVDDKTLTRIAEKTGGMYRVADTEKALRAIYEEINQLEKSEVESVRYMDYKEYFSRFALMAFCLLALETVLRTTVFRKIP